jgi:hypothetical protein
MKVKRCAKHSCEFGLFLTDFHPGVGSADVSGSGTPIRVRRPATGLAGGVGFDQVPCVDRGASARAAGAWIVV